MEAGLGESGAYNWDADAHRTGFGTGEPEVTEWFMNQVLKSPPYPNAFQPAGRVAYRPENRHVVIEFELPAQQVVPIVRAYRNVKARDAVDPVARLATEVRQRYARLITCVALRTLHEVFRATPNEVVEAVVFDRRANTIDRATASRLDHA